MTPQSACNISMKNKMKNRNLNENIHKGNKIGKEKEENSSFGKNKNESEQITITKTRSGLKDITSKSNNVENIISNKDIDAADNSNNVEEDGLKNVDSRKMPQKNYIMKEDNDMTICYTKNLQILIGTIVRTEDLTQLELKELNFEHDDDDDECTSFVSAATSSSSTTSSSIDEKEENDQKSAKPETFLEDLDLDFFHDDDEDSFHLLLQIPDLAHVVKEEEKEETEDECHKDEQEETLATSESEVNDEFSVDFHVDDTSSSIESTEEMHSKSFPTSTESSQDKLNEHLELSNYFRTLNDLELSFLSSNIQQEKVYSLEDFANFFEHTSSNILDYNVISKQTRKLLNCNHRVSLNYIARKSKFFLVQQKHQLQRVTQHSSLRIPHQNVFKLPFKRHRSVVFPYIRMEKLEASSLE